ncbi:MAG TPA: hypothetical protein VFO29_11990 [Candidatus Rubrimentiphilum sp.]|nr:hypothetical protein [Candidatus Rubrimentiphilum sp.]
MVCNIGEAELNRLVSQADPLQLSERCCFLNAALSEDLMTRSPVEVQPHFIDLVGKDPNRDEVVAELVQRRTGVVAEPTALATMAAFTLTCATGTSHDVPFLKILMALNFETLREPGTEKIRFDADSMSSAIAASATLGTERYLNVRWRFREFIIWSRSEEARRHHAYVNIDEELMQAFGTTYEDLMAGLTAIDTLTDFTLIRERGRAWVSAAEILRDDRLGIIRRLLSHMSISRHNLADIVRATQLHYLRGVMHALFLRSPVVEFENERYLVPAPRLLDNAMALGWVYALADARAALNKKASAQFWIFFGAFFERYIVGILERIGRAMGMRVFPEQDLGQFRTSDAILQSDNSIYFFEVVSSRLSANVLRDPSDDAELNREFEQKVFGKVDQLAENIRRFYAGEFAQFGLNPDKSIAVYPVLVQYRSFLRTDAFQRTMEKRFQERLGIQAPNVRVVEILDSEILESMEEHLAADRPLGGLIDEKLGDAATRSSLFKNFMSLRHPELPLRLPPQIAQWDRDWQGEILATVGSWR